MAEEKKVTAAEEQQNSAPEQTASAEPSGAAAAEQHSKEEKREKSTSGKKLKEELETLKQENAELKAQAEKQADQLMRTLAEYDNFRKRTAKEKEDLTLYCVAKAVEKLLPALDAMDAAAKVEGGSAEDIKKGLELIRKQLLDGFAAIGIEEIPTDAGFDPELHNAMMHIEDESLGENVIAEVFQKGYRYKDKIVRHSLVKVAN